MSDNYFLFFFFFNKYILKVSVCLFKNLLKDWKHFYSNSSVILSICFSCFSVLSIFALSYYLPKGEVSLVIDYLWPIESWFNLFFFFLLFVEVDLFVCLWLIIPEKNTEIKYFWNRWHVDSFMSHQTVLINSVWFPWHMLADPFWQCNLI